MRRVRPLGQVKPKRKSSMPVGSYTSVRELQDNELLSPARFQLPYRKNSEPLPPSTILLGRQLTSLSPGPSQSPLVTEQRNETQTDNRLSPDWRRSNVLLSRRRTSEPAAFAAVRPPPSPLATSPQVASPTSSSRVHSPRLASPFAAIPSLPPRPTICAEVQVKVEPDPALIQRCHDLDAEIAVLLSHQTELENNARSCGLQGEEYKRLYEAEVVAHERSKMNQKVVQDRLEEVAARRQRLLAEHEAAVSATRREFTLRTDAERREHAHTLNSFAKKLLTLGACIPTKTTAVNERQNQLALLLKDKQALLDEIDHLRERVGRIKLDENEDEEEAGEKEAKPCRTCETKAEDLGRLKEECAKREARISELQQRIRIVEGDADATQTGIGRHHSARSTIGQRQT